LICGRNPGFLLHDLKTEWPVPQMNKLFTSGRLAKTEACATRECSDDGDSLRAAWDAVTFVA
jgi:hypothetical protein